MRKRCGTENSGAAASMRGQGCAPAARRLACLSAEEKAGGPVDAGTVATSVVGITGAVALLVAGTATLKYWQARLPRPALQ